MELYQTHLFRFIINNSVLRLVIFNQVRSIHRNLGLKRYYWKKLINNHDSILVKYNYINLFKDYSGQFLNKQSIRMNIVESISSSRLEFFKFLVSDLKLFQKYPDQFGTLASTACKCNSLELLQYLENQIWKQQCDNRSIEKVFINSPVHNQLPLVQWLSSQVTSTVVTMSSSAMLTAATEGRLEILQWLVLSRPRENDFTTAFKVSLLNGHFQVAKWLFDNYKNCITQYNIVDRNQQQTKKISCNREMFEWMKANNITVYSPSITIDNAANEGNFEAVKWLHMYGSDTNGSCTKNAMDNAAKHSLEMIQWFHNNRKEGCTRNAILNAIAVGHSNIVEWLYRNRKECRSPITDILNGMITHHHNEVTKLVIEDNSFTFTRDVEFLKDMFLLCCSTGNLVVYKYLEEMMTVFQIDIPSSSNHWTRCCMKACSEGRFYMVKYFHENSNSNRYESVFLKDSMDMAIRNGSIEIVRFLFENRKEGCNQGSLMYAIRDGNLEMVQFLLINELVKFTKDLLVFEDKDDEYYPYITKWLKNYRRSLEKQPIFSKKTQQPRRKRNRSTT